MTGASRQKAYRTYEVTVRREVEYTQVVEVEARSAEEACDVAKNTVDNPHARWNEGDLVSMTCKAKVLR